MFHCAVHGRNDPAIKPNNAQAVLLERHILPQFFDARKITKYTTSYGNSEAGLSTKLF